MSQLGRLEQVDLKEFWDSEAGHFTPWLATEANLALLGDAIGLELECEAQEKSVGPFRADILCKDTASGNWVLIENQLQRTDHSHLGQLLTYAAGLKAVTIVWIASRFTDEHRAALDWLNSVTAEGVSFFGLEIELWRIGNSPMAPKFNVVCKPNNWTKRDPVVTELTEGKQLQLEFWTGFREFALDKAKHIKATKPLPQLWMNIALGRADCWLVAVASTYDSEKGTWENGELRAELNLGGDHAKAHFALLEATKGELESKLGEPLIWYTTGKKTCRVYYRQPVDIQDRNKWPQYFAWLVERLDRMHCVLRPIVKKLDASEFEPDAETVA